MTPSRRRPPPPPLLIFVGLYQEELVRFRVAGSDDEEVPYLFRLEQLQSDHVHQGSINVLRNSGSLVASGGADGKVVVLDVAKGTSWDVAMPNEESVNSMDFGSSGRFLFVGGAERSLFHVDLKKRAVTCRKWNVHQSGVVAVRVRPPTGRIMFTVGQDRSVRSWDLYLSRTTVTDEFRSDGRFTGPISCLEFSPSGNMLAVAGESFARVTLIRECRIVRAVTFEGEKPVAAVWLSESVLLIGMSSGRGVTLRIDDEGEPRWTRFYRDGKLMAMARVGNNLATTSNRSVLTLWEILEEFRFWPLCHAEIAGKATSLVMIDTTQLSSKEIPDKLGKMENETLEDPSNEESTEQNAENSTSPTDLWNNTFGDTPPDNGEDESEMYQIIPETPTQELSVQSLIDCPAEVASDSSLESLRVSDDPPNSNQSDSGSEELFSDEQIIVMMCQERSATLGGGRTGFNFDYDGDNEGSDNGSDPILVGSGEPLNEGAMEF